MNDYSTEHRGNARSSFDPFSLGFAGAAFYFIFFLLVPLLQAVGIDVGTPYAVSVPREAATVIGAGLIGLFGGYMLFPRSLVRRVPNILSGAWDYRRVAWMVGALTVLGIAAKAVRLAGGGYFHTWKSASFLSSPFTSLIGHLDWAGPIAFGIALLMYYSFAKSDTAGIPRWGATVAGLFTMEILFAVFSCSREAIFVVPVLYLLIRWYAKGIAWWKALFAVFFLVAIVFPWGNACRSSLVRENLLAGQEGDVSVVSLAQSSARLTVGSFFSRINHSFTIVYVVAADLSDFKSRFVVDFLTSFAPPRFLWTDKPVSINGRGNEFGHRAGILSPDDSLTAVGPTLPGEFFINFGFAGVLIGMALFGLLLKFLYVYLVGRNVRTPSAILVYGVAWLTLLRGLEHWAVPLLAGFIKILILLLVIHFIIRKRSAAVAPVSL